MEHWSVKTREWEESYLPRNTYTHTTHPSYSFWLLWETVLKLWKSWKISNFSIFQHVRLLVQTQLNFFEKAQLKKFWTKYLNYGILNFIFSSPLTSSAFLRKKARILHPEIILLQNSCLLAEIMKKAEMMQ